MEFQFNLAAEGVLTQNMNNRTRAQIMNEMQERKLKMEYEKLDQMKSGAEKDGTREKNFVYRKKIQAIEEKHKMIIKHKSGSNGDAPSESDEAPESKLGKGETDTQTHGRLVAKPAAGKPNFHKVKGSMGQRHDSTNLPSKMKLQFGASP